MFELLGFEKRSRLCYVCIYLFIFVELYVCIRIKKIINKMNIFISFKFFLF